MLAPQTRKVFEHIVKVGSITGLEAAGLYRVRSLTKRISEIRKQGHPIQSEFKRDRTGQRYVKYHYLGTLRPGDVAVQ